MLLSRHLHVFSHPERVNRLMVYLPMTFHKHPNNVFGPEAWTLSSQSTHFTKSMWFIIHPAQRVSLSTARWIEHTTRSTLRNLLWPQSTTHFGGRSSSTFGVYQLVSLRGFLQNLMSKARSATLFFNRAFSFCSALRSLAISGCMPPTFCRQR